MAGSGGNIQPVPLLFDPDGLARETGRNPAATQRQHILWRSMMSFLKRHAIPVLLAALVICGAGLDSCSSLKGRAAPEKTAPQAAPETKPAPPAPEAKPESKQPTAEEKKIAALQGADTLLQSGKADEAVAKIEEAAAAQPENPELNLLKAAALASAGKTAEARAVADAILAKEPANPGALLMAVNLARFAGDDAARKAYLDRGIAAAPQDSGILAAYGDYLLERKTYAKAEDFFRRSQAADQNNPDAALGLGQTLYAEAKYPESEAALDVAIALDPDSVYAWADRSKTRYRRGKYEEALNDLSTAIGKAPDLSWLYLDRGRIYLNAGKNAEATADFSSAIDKEPDYFLPYVYRAGIYESQGRDEEAFTDYKKIIALEPDYWYAYESLGATSFRLADWAEAAGNFQNAFGHAGDTYEYAIAAGIALLRAGKKAEARDWAGTIAPSMDREKYGIHWLMLRLIQDQNDQSSELEVKIQSEKRLDTKAAMLFYLGEYWLSRGKGELATKYFILSRDMKRSECLEYRLLQPELSRLGIAKTKG